LFGIEEGVLAGQGITSRGSRISDRSRSTGGPKCKELRPMPYITLRSVIILATTLALGLLNDSAMWPRFASNEATPFLAQASADDDDDDRHRSWRRSRDDDDDDDD
jgi:hypothetical protein